MIRHDPENQESPVPDDSVLREIYVKMSNSRHAPKQRNLPMFDYQLLLLFDYPKKHRTVKFDDGFDLNSREKVRSFINNEALPRLCKLGKIGSNNEDVQEAGGIIEGMLDDDLYEVVNRAKLLDYVVENYERDRQTHAKFVEGLVALKNKTGH